MSAMTMKSFTDILDAWNDPQMKHAMVVHMPITLSIIAAILGLLLAFQPRSVWLRSLALIAVLLLAASAWVASGSGEAAEAGIEGALTSAAAEELDEHEDMGALVWFFAACAGGLVALTFIPQRTVQHIAGALSAVGLLLIAAWTAVVAHHGGTLVYEFGVGAPRSIGAASGANASDPAVTSTLASAGDARLAHFAEVVRPILEQNCWGCHNPSRARRNGGLDLTTMDSILAGGATENEAVVTPGQPDGSLMIKAVRYDDPFLQMPPARNGQLSAEEIAALERWVREGAVWTTGPGPLGDWEAPSDDASRDADD